MAKVVAEGLYKIFGPQKQIETALEHARNGKSISEIKEETGCTIAVNDVSFTVDGPEIFVIMGLSGSGKSTLLRCINRLIEPTAGNVTVDDEDVLEMDLKSVLLMREKKMAMVFQHFGLLTHRTVLENAAFGLELRGVKKNDREEQARETLELVGLEGYAESMVDELSGGMQQRVGLARALTTKADILLMDEAFSALDPLIRNEMQTEFLELQKKIPKTILFITHDLGEALRMGDRIGILKGGSVVQIGTPEEIVMDPATDYVKAFVENVDRTRVLKVGTTTGDTKPALSTDETVENAVNTMRQMNIPYIFTVKDGHPEGVLSLKDAEMESRKENPDLADIVRPVPDAISPDEHLISILTRASEVEEPLPVVDKDGQLTGMLTKDMILRAIAGGHD